MSKQSGTTTLNDSQSPVDANAVAEGPNSSTGSKTSCQIAFVPHQGGVNRPCWLRWSRHGYRFAQPILRAWGTGRATRKAPQVHVPSRATPATARAGTNLPQYLVPAGSRRSAGSRWESRASPRHSSAAIPGTDRARPAPGCEYLRSP